eukprot:m.193260 g.193260  ORF g.193260 m.193260 type:complete len:751 (+) comp14878_c3_seq3:86-2338(+)
MISCDEMLGHKAKKQNKAASNTFMTVEGSSMEGKERSSADGIIGHGLLVPTASRHSVRRQSTNTQPSTSSRRRRNLPQPQPAQPQSQPQRQLHDAPVQGERYQATTSLHRITQSVQRPESRSDEVAQTLRSLSVFESARTCCLKSSTTVHPAAVSTTRKLQPDAATAVDKPTLKPDLHSCIARDDVLGTLKLLEAKAATLPRPGQTEHVQGDLATVLPQLSPRVVVQDQDREQKVPGAFAAHSPPTPKYKSGLHRTSKNGTSASQLDRVPIPFISGLMIFAAKRSSSNTLRRLCQLFPNALGEVDTTGDTIFHVLARLKDTGTLRRLRSLSVATTCSTTHSIGFSEQTRTTSARASPRLQERIRKVLRQLNGSRQTALSVAVVGGDVQTVEALVALGADPNQHQSGANTPLIQVISAYITSKKQASLPPVQLRGLSRLSRSMAPSRGPISALNLERHTALPSLQTHPSTPSNTAIPIIETLLRLGADPTIPSTAGYPALNLVAAEACTDILLLLLKYGADINQSRNGWSPLMAALSKGHLDFSRLLCERGADVNAVDDMLGLTPLLVAARAKSNARALVALLLSYKAKLDQPFLFASAADSTDDPVIRGWFNQCTQFNELLFAVILQDIKHVHQLLRGGHCPAQRFQFGDTTVSALEIARRSTFPAFKSPHPTLPQLLCFVAFPSVDTSLPLESFVPILDLSLKHLLVTLFLAYRRLHANNPKAVSIPPQALAVVIAHMRRSSTPLALDQ